MWKETVNLLTLAYLVYKNFILPNKIILKYSIVNYLTTNLHTHKI